MILACSDGVRTQARIGASAFALALVLAGCGPVNDFADWTIEVPEGTRVVEYVEVADEERSGRIDLVEDLRIGRPGADPTYSFDNPRNVAVDSAGRIYVADSGDHEVKVYDADGTHLRTLGRQGEGPGEFRGPGSVTVAAGRVVVSDTGRTSFWDMEGNYVGSAAAIHPTSWRLRGRDDGTYLARYPSIDDDGRQAAVFVRFDEEGGELTRYPSLLDPQTTWYPSRDADPHIGLSVAPAIPVYAMAPGGLVYLTQADLYQVFAFEADGTMAWALRVADVEQPVARAEIERAMDSIHTRWPDAKEAEVDWPRRQPSLRGLMVDGHGHLYVFPYVIAGMEPEEQPVDVYSAAGERLFSGWIPSHIWLWARRFDARGDFVYDIQTNEETGEDQVVRFRLVEPF